MHQRAPEGAVVRDTIAVEHHNPKEQSMTDAETPFEKRMSRRLLGLARKLDLPALDCWISEEWFGPDECGPATSSISATICPAEGEIVGGHGRTRLAAAADGLRRLAEYHYSRGASFGERIFSPGEKASREVVALMPLFRTNGHADLVALCSSDEPYLRELGLRLSKFANPTPPRRRNGNATRVPRLAGGVNRRSVP
jgi:hypothetical protein